MKTHVAWFWIERSTELASFGSLPLYENSVGPVNDYASVFTQLYQENTIK